VKILHEGQIKIDDIIVKKLIMEQFPQYKDLPILEYNTTGTVNAIYRLGNDYYVRLPILEIYDKDVLREYNILNYISNKISINIPQIIGIGKPNELYPYNWAIHNWIEGDCYDNNKITYFQDIISELVYFINELHSIDVFENAPKAGRKPLMELNSLTIESLNNSKEEIDYKKAIKIWEILVNTSLWDNNPVWIHADLLKPNIKIKNNHIIGIIDFGSAGIGDPAFDIIPAWAVFNKECRDIFRDKLNICENTWNRGCAYALHQAALIIPYYRNNNKSFVKNAIETINEIIIDYNGIV